MAEAGSALCTDRRTRSRAKVYLPGMGILERLARLDRAAEARTGGRKREVPGQLPAIFIGLFLVALGTGAALSGESEPAYQLLCLGIGTNFGASVVALAVRRSARRSGVK